MNGVLSQPRTKLFQLQFFAARFAFVRIVVVAGFFANQKHGFGFFLALGHIVKSVECSVSGELWHRDGPASMRFERFRAQRDDTVVRRGMRRPIITDAVEGQTIDQPAKFIGRLGPAHLELIGHQR